MDLPGIGPGVLLAIIAGAAVVFLLRMPEVGLLAGVLAFYLNLPALAVRIHGVPGAFVAVSALIVAPAAFQSVFARRPVVDRPFLLMLLFLGTTLLSFLIAKDSDLALAWILKYVGEGLFLYLVVINLIRTARTLRRVAWTLILAGAFLSSLTLYQEVTHSYRSDFGGLAQRMLERETPEQAAGRERDPRTRPKIRIAHRAQGPIDDPNRYAQILIVLLPLGVACGLQARRRVGQIAASAGTVTILGGLLLTYSRGAFVAMFVMAGAAVAMRLMRPLHFAAVLLVFGGAAAILAPGYAARMLTLRGLQGLADRSENIEPDAVERGRAAEMLAAYHVFQDYPILGVGPGQFAPVYSVAYMSEEYSLRRLTEQRRAHSLYLELAAETGLVGLSVFVAIVIVVMRRLARVWRDLRRRESELAGYAAALLLGIVGYLATGIFLQLSFQRYYWFLLALAGATVQIAAARAAQKTGPATDQVAAAAV